MVVNPDARERSSTGFALTPPMRYARSSIVSSVKLKAITLIRSSGGTGQVSAESLLLAVNGANAKDTPRTSSVKPPVGEGQFPRVDANPLLRFTLHL